MATCKRCYRIVDRACGSDTESYDCVHLRAARTDDVLQKAEGGTVANHRPIHAIARDIRAAWGPTINYGAKPYLQALETLVSPTDAYGAETGRVVALYFLGNAGNFRGPQARALKAELKAAYGIK